VDKWLENLQKTVAAPIPAPAKKAEAITDELLIFGDDAPAIEKITKAFDDGSAGPADAVDVLLAKAEEDLLHKGFTDRAWSEPIGKAVSSTHDALFEKEFGFQPNY
jgi:hypothetical protein